MTPAVKKKSAPLTAPVVGTITGRAARTVLAWMKAKSLPSSFKVIENRRQRVTTSRALQAFMRRHGIPSKVGWFKVVGGGKAAPVDGRRKGKAKHDGRRRAG